MKRLLLLGFLLVAGAVSAVAVAAATTGTVSVCATTPAQTIAANGTPVATIAGSSACATTTFTAPTVTDTVTTTETVTTTAPTATTTTPPATTTTATTTTATGSPTFASETAYTQNRPAFTPSRTVSVSTGAELKTAVANLQPGDYVKASAPFTLSSGGTSDTLIVANRLSAPAVIDLAGVSIVYTGTANQNAVWVRNAENVRIYGGDISDSQGTVGGGSCVAWTGSQHTLWWGFDIHGCGSSGMGIFTAGPTYSFAGPTENDDIEGTIHDFSLNHGLFDNHQEKCSGVHGANLSDNNWYAFDHNRIALDVYNSACTGGGIEFGSSKSPSTSPAGPIPDSNTIILECDSLTFVSTIQTGGNCLQQWGYGDTHTDIKYLVASNLMGHTYWAGGMYQKPNPLLSSDTIEYGRASNTDQNPRYAKDCTFGKESQTVFQDVSPPPCLAPFTS